MNFIRYIPSKIQKSQQLNQGSVSLSRSSSVATSYMYLLYYQLQKKTLPSDANNVIILI